MAEAFSLLTPPNLTEKERSESFFVGDAVVEDLGIRELAAAIAGPALTGRQAMGIVGSPSANARLIRYRHDILGDLLDDDALRKGIEEIIPRIRELFYFNKVRKESESPLLQAVWRLGELELYVECVERLHELLRAPERSIKSEGLVGLTERLQLMRTETTFERMKTELPRLRDGLKKRRSVTIGINLDEKLRPVEAALVSINDRRYTSKTFFGRLFGSSADGREFESLTPMHTTPVEESDGAEAIGRESLPLSPLFQDIELLIRSVVHPVVESLKSYIQVNAAFLRPMAVEFAFYIGAAKLARSLETRGLPVCKPRIDHPGRRITRASGFYNIQLALKKSTVAPDHGSRIVLNDVALDDAGRIQILTGPNQGGKTTYTQGIGILHLMAQIGLYVPARAALLSPVDAILTHFPVGETGRIGTGRLAEEAERLAAVFRRVTSRSLVLLNESLSSTSPAESLVLAEDVVKALRHLGARCVYATHLHELASAVARLNRETPGASIISSLVAGVEPGPDAAHRRTYRVTPGPPIGKSYAKDVARRFGLEFDELVRRLGSRDSRHGKEP